MTADLPGPLQLASMDELLDEIKRRHSVYFMVLERLDNLVAADTSNRKIVYGGGWTAAIGLCRYASAIFDEQLRRCAARTEDADEEERLDDA